MGHKEIDLCLHGIHDERQTCMGHKEIDLYLHGIHGLVWVFMNHRQEPKLHSWL